jgi:tricorn protease
MDVFLAPLAGGPPERLTFHSADDHVVAFLPGGEGVVFLSRRDTPRHRVYSVPVAGGQPSVLLTVPATAVTFSPDGSKVAFPLGSMHWWRQGYRGAGNFDLWIRTLAGGKARRVTAWEGNDTHPLWRKDGTLLFLSDRKGKANLWKTDPSAPAKAVQVTFHKHHPVLNPSLSPDGRWVA